MRYSMGRNLAIEKPKMWFIPAVAPRLCRRPAAVRRKFASCERLMVNGRMPKMATDDSAASVSDVKVAVIGTGSLGKEHVRIYSELAAAQKLQFVGVYDAAAETAQRFAQRYGVRRWDMSNDSIRSSNIWKRSQPSRASSRHIGFHLIRRGAQTSAWCWI